MRRNAPLTRYRAHGPVLFPPLDQAFELANVDPKTLRPLLLAQWVFGRLANHMLTFHILTTHFRHPCGHAFSFVITPGRGHSGFLVTRSAMVLTLGHFQGNFGRGAAHSICGCQQCVVGDHLWF